jgi:hypothetical protein
MMGWMNQDRWTAVTCFVISGMIALAIPSQTSDRPLPGARGFDVLDGAFFPEIAVSLFFIASIWLFVEARPQRVFSPGAELGTNSQLDPPDSQEGKSDLIVERASLVSDDQPPGMSFRDLVWALALTGGLLVYVQLLSPLGYLVSTIIGVSLLALVCGQRSLAGFFFGGVVFPTVVFYLFTKLFMVPLPLGFL